MQDNTQIKSIWAAHFTAATWEGGPLPCRPLFHFQHDTQGSLSLDLVYWQQPKSRCSLSNASL